MQNQLIAGILVALVIAMTGLSIKKPDGYRRLSWIIIKSALVLEVLYFIGFTCYQLGYYAGFSDEIKRELRNPGLDMIIPTGFLLYFLFLQALPFILHGKNKKTGSGDDAPNEPSK